MSSIAKRGVRTGKAGDRVTKIRKGKNPTKMHPPRSHTNPPKNARRGFM